MFSDLPPHNKRLPVVTTYKTRSQNQCHMGRYVHTRTTERARADIDDTQHVRLPCSIKIALEMFEEDRLQCFLRVELVQIHNLRVNGTSGLALYTHALNNYAHVCEHACRNVV